MLFRKAPKYRAQYIRGEFYIAERLTLCCDVPRQTGGAIAVCSTKGFPDWTGKAELYMMDLALVEVCRHARDMTTCRAQGYTQVDEPPRSVRMTSEG